MHDICGRHADDRMEHRTSPLIQAMSIMPGPGVHVGYASRAKPTDCPVSREERPYRSLRYHGCACLI